MTNIGQTLCLVCGQISCEQVFYYSTLNVAITVAKNWRNQYTAFASTSDGKTLFVQLHEKPTIDKDTGTILKLKLELAVRGNNTPHSVTLHARNRICPHCLWKGHITCGRAILHSSHRWLGRHRRFTLDCLGYPVWGRVFF